MFFHYIVVKVVISFYDRFPRLSYFFTSYISKLTILIPQWNLPGPWVRDCFTSSNDARDWQPRSGLNLWHSTEKRWNIKEETFLKFICNLFCMLCFISWFPVVKDNIQGWEAWLHANVNGKLKNHQHLLNTSWLNFKMCLVALVNKVIFQMTLKLNLFTVEF